MRRNVGKLLAARTLQGRSPLYRWLHAHHAEIAAHMATQTRPGWEALAQTARDTIAHDGSHWLLLVACEALAGNV